MHAGQSGTTQKHGKNSVTTVEVEEEMRFRSFQKTGTLPMTARTKETRSKTKTDCARLLLQVNEPLSVVPIVSRRAGACLATYLISAMDNQITTA